VKLDISEKDVKEKTKICHSISGSKKKNNKKKKLKIAHGERRRSLEYNVFPYTNLKEK